MFIMDFSEYIRVCIEKLKKESSYLNPLDVEELSCHLLITFDIMDKLNAPSTEAVECLICLII